MSETVLARPAVIGVPRLARYGALGGLAGGAGMAMWQMIDSAVTGSGFWTPVNVCMASFVYRGEAAMIVRDMMAHPGMSMNMPVAAGHVAVGMMLHMAFSMMAGVVFAVILAGLGRAGLGLLRTAAGWVAASVAGAALLYAVMVYLVLPWANPLMNDMTPRVPLFIGHVVFGMVLGLVTLPVRRLRAA